MKRDICILVLFLTIIYGGCVTPRYIYSSSKLNNPYFKEKGESKAGAYYSSSDNGSTGEHSAGLDIQSAYAISNHWAVMGSYFYRNEKDFFDNSDDYDTSVIRYKRNLFEGGVGYFIAINHRKTITANLYTGAAIGNFSFKEKGYLRSGVTNKFHNAHITKWFIQPSFNFSPGRYVRFAYIFRPSFVHYGNVRTNYSDMELADYKLDVAGKTITMMEQELNLQVGLPSLPWLKLDLGISGAGLTDPEDYYVREISYSVGFNIDFSKMKKKE